MCAKEPIGYLSRVVKVLLFFFKDKGLCFDIFKKSTYKLSANHPILTQENSAHGPSKEINNTKVATTRTSSFPSAISPLILASLLAGRPVFLAFEGYVLRLCLFTSRLSSLVHAIYARSPYLHPFLRSGFPLLCDFYYSPYSRLTVQRYRHWP